MEKSQFLVKYDKKLWAIIIGISFCLFISLLLTKNTPVEAIVNNPLEVHSEQNWQVVQFDFVKPDGTPAPISANEPATHTQQAQENQAHLTTEADTKSSKKEQAELNITRSTPKKLSTISVTVQQGDNLFKIFQDHSLTPNTLHKITNSYKDPASPLRYIYPGQEITFTLDSSTKDVISLSFDKSPLTRVVIAKNNAGDYKATEHSKTIDTIQAHASGIIEDSFYTSAKRAHLSDKTIMEFADIFAWDVDFTLDLRTGDSFEVLYEQNRLNNNRLLPGKILGARFTNQNRTITAIAYTHPDGRTSYYTPDGKNIRKAFLRSPVSFARISSHFNLRRKHPILHSIRAHKGVDYAARRGTPIKATGDGKIIHAKRKGGYGRTVIIQHGQRYSTLYAHLQGYAKNIKKGKKVKQGDVIGYIGSSGLATGPHLHYEFRVNGIHKNPLKVKFPDAEPIQTKYRQAFNAVSHNISTKLNQHLATKNSIAQAK